MRFQVLTEDDQRNQRLGFIEAADLDDVKKKILPHKLIGAFAVLGTIKKEKEDGERDTPEVKQDH